MGSLQVIISHYQVMGKVWGQYQSWTITQMSLAQTSLQLTLSKPSHQLHSSPQIEELWANTMLSNWPMGDYTAQNPRWTLDCASTHSWNGIELGVEKSLKFTRMEYNLKLKFYWLLKTTDLCHLPIYLIYWSVSPTYLCHLVNMCHFPEVSIILLWDECELCSKS